MPSPLDLTDRVAVVIGATSGIGRALAIGLAQHGAIVVASGRRADRVDEVAAEIESVGRRTLRQTVDVTDRHSIGRLRDAVLEEFGRVDILLNAAGRTLKKPFIDIAEQEWQSVLDTNLTGILRACQSFYKSLNASGRGRVINIASLGSFRSFEHVAAYSASKAALLCLTKSLGCEWARDGISVNAIAPGVFPTELNRNIILGTARGTEMLMRTPMGRFGRPEELIGAAVLLASDAASFITGQCIVVDGGYLASGVNSE
jgi:NAD(P)-dependent dehydrogenase (short-subunit alcohol dehydrogenase family)